MSSFDRPSQDRGWATRQERSTATATTNSNHKSSSSSSTAVDQARHFSSSYDRGKRYEEHSTSARDSKTSAMGSGSASVGSGKWRVVTSTTHGDRNSEQRHDRETASGARRGVATNDDRRGSSTSRSTTAAAQYDSSKRARDDERHSNFSNRAPLTSSRRYDTSPTRTHPSKHHHDDDQDDRPRSIDAPPPTRPNRQPATFSSHNDFNPASRKTYPGDPASSNSTSGPFYPVQRRAETDAEQNVSRPSGSDSRSPSPASSSSSSKRDVHHHPHHHYHPSRRIDPTPTQPQASENEPGSKNVASSEPKAFFSAPRPKMTYTSRNPDSNSKSSISNGYGRDQYGSGSKIERGFKSGVGGKGAGLDKGWAGARTQNGRWREREREREGRKDEGERERRETDRTVREERSVEPKWEERSRDFDFLPSTTATTRRRSAIPDSMDVEPLPPSTSSSSTSMQRTPSRERLQMTHRQPLSLKVTSPTNTFQASNGTGSILASNDVGSAMSGVGMGAGVGTGSMTKAGQVKRFFPAESEDEIWDGKRTKRGDDEAERGADDERDGERIREREPEREREKERERDRWDRERGRERDAGTRRRRPSDADSTTSSRRIREDAGAQREKKERRRKEEEHDRDQGRERERERGRDDGWGARHEKEKRKKYDDEEDEKSTRDRRREPKDRESDEEEEGRKRWSRNESKGRRASFTSRERERDDGYDKDRSTKTRSWGPARGAKTDSRWSPTTSRTSRYDDREREQDHERDLDRARDHDRDRERSKFNDRKEGRYDDDDRSSTTTSKKNFETRRRTEDREFIHARGRGRGRGRGSFGGRGQDDYRDYNKRGAERKGASSHEDKDMDRSRDRRTDVGSEDRPSRSYNDRSDTGYRYSSRRDDGDDHKRRDDYYRRNDDDSRRRRPPSTDRRSSRATTPPTVSTLAEGEEPSAGNDLELAAAPDVPVVPAAPPPTEIYECLVQVGEGTYGKVYKARNTETGALVALKRIRMEAEKDGFPITAVREIKLLQSLRHSNVVNLLEMMVSKGTLGYLIDGLRVERTEADQTKF
ncbi:BZ3500_MvSof-1268-A1-R1_Chr10-2g02988 [Microbotryum saponariae]|uniref:cyclin-dependent kinase n=1 Tax=Microbotryum saponariae TaxID=289078 RepID=A0A2X0M9Y3_9BASI|nr:BZ3501_MvSof-1269-A2-R1_Chr10-2g02574 [Microbotryum saponariae]SDA01882.1 BZ3500_MvSof-1268-A1-R1_Chr10-2g02988 [Microbotryum saponariae]